jgi:hypothetical protein
MTDDPLHDSRQAGRLPHEIDRRLRETFEPDGVSVARVVAAAASGEAPGHRRGSLRLAWAAVALIAVAVAAGIYERPRAPAPAEPAELLISGSFTEDVLILRAPDGSISLSGPGVRDDRPQDGSGIVFVEGDPK